MKIKTELIRRIQTSRPYIYCTKDKYYFLSASACRECDDEEEVLIDEMNCVLNKLEKAGDEIDKAKIRKDELEEIARIYAKIKERDGKFNYSSHERAKNKIEILFNGFSREEVENVHRQRENLAFVKWCVAQHSGILKESF